VSVIAGVAIFGAMVAAIESFRVVTRRSLLKRWARDQGFTLLEARFSAASLERTGSLVAYRVRVRDRTGHEVTGIAWTTGFLRRRVTVDWGAQGRWTTPSP
jgi:hypothetical protein